MVLIQTTLQKIKLSELIAKQYLKEINLFPLRKPFARSALK